MTIPLVVVGAGGFGRECLDVVGAINDANEEPVYDVLGVVDSGLSDVNHHRLSARGIPWLGSESDWLTSGVQAQYLIAIGDPSTRMRLDTTFRDAGFRAAVAIHPTATLGSMVAIGEGSIVCGGAQIATNCQLGRGVTVNASATIGHDTAIADFVSINPAATVSGDVTIESGTLVGAGAVILQGLKIAEDVVVGASACVVRNVAQGQTVKGVPAR